MKKIMDRLRDKFRRFLCRLMRKPNAISAWIRLRKKMNMRGEDVYALCDWVLHCSHDVKKRVCDMAFDRALDTTESLWQFSRKFPHLYVEGLYLAYKGYEDRKAQMLAARDKENLITTD